MKKIFLSFLLIITFVCNSGISAHAFSIQEVANDLYLSKVHTDNTIRLLLEDIGVILSPSKWGSGALNDLYQEYLVEKALIITSDSYEDYLRAHLTVTEDENGESIIVADNDMMNTLYDFSQNLIVEGSGFIVLPTRKYTELPLDVFNDKRDYECTLKFLSDMPSNGLIRFNGYYSYEHMSYSGIFWRGIRYVYYNLNTSAFVINTEKSDDISFICNVYDVNTWQLISRENITLKDHLTVSSGYKHDPHANSLYSSGAVSSSSGDAHSRVTLQNDYSDYNWYWSPYTLDGRTVRVYKSVDDMRAYTLNQRPFYVTTEYNNYDSTVDNSTTINQTTIDNSVAYGDVYNYITNNYENPDGLTEDELRDVLDDYLDELKNNQNNNDSGGSGGSGSDDSSGSGGGLSGLLSGLGSLGDAVMAILGKLFEYVGKALELFSGLITNIIDIIPGNVTALLSGLFPFIPEEWLVVIELGLVLGVILKIVGGKK